MKPLVFTGLLLAVTCSLSAQTTYNSKIDISCGGIYHCLADEDYKSLIGKKLTYHHANEREFGDVVIQLKADGSASAQNRKGIAGDGPWQIKDGKLVIKFARWGESTLQLIRVGDDHLFARPNGVAFLIPVEVSN